MKNNPIIPIIISTIQLFCIIHLFYLHNFSNSHIPKAFIFLHFYALLGIFILILSYILYFKKEIKSNFWRIPIGFSVILIFALIICHIIMGINKYN